MSMQTTSDNAEGEPMLDINTTPLIDVMLVLLIMFIITIPIQTHAVKLDLPQNTDQPPPPVLPVLPQQDDRLLLRQLVHRLPLKRPSSSLRGQQPTLVVQRALRLRQPF